MSALDDTSGTVHVWSARGQSDGDTVLRAVLAHHMELPPERVPLGRASSGRPVVGGGTALQVSVSHTSGLVLVAVGLGPRVGVDVELLRERPLRLLPAHALSAHERAVLDRCPTDERVHALLRYWVRKEAVLKAAGVGLAIDPREVEVSSPTDPARVVSLPEALERPLGWALVDLELEGYVAALAVDGPTPRTVEHQLAA